MLVNDDECLPIYTVYRNPRDCDYLGRYMIRRSRIYGGGVMRTDREPLAVGDTLEEVRAHLPEGLTRLERHAHDDDVIVEVWL